VDWTGYPAGFLGGFMWIFYLVWTGFDLLNVHINPNPDIYGCMVIGVVSANRLMMNSLIRNDSVGNVF
jgi:hypothetical protein